MLKSTLAYGLIIGVLFTLNGHSVDGQDIKWNAIFNPKTITIHMHESAPINLTINGLDANRLKIENATIEVRSDNVIAEVNFPIPLNDIVNGTWTGKFDINAIFLGSANIHVVITLKNGGAEQSKESLPVIIIREERIIDRVFTFSVAALVSILYINFGAAIDLTKVKAIVLRPIGPLIAMFCQFVFLPLVSSIIIYLSLGNFDKFGLFCLYLAQHYKETNLIKISVFNNFKSE